MITSYAEDVVFVSTRAKRIENAKSFLQDNLIEIIACVACIYDLIKITLYSSISRQKKENENQNACKKRHEDNNKILQQHEINALHKLIKSLLMSNISSTHSLLFEVICFLKSKEKSNSSTRR
jgi:uncharacterized protein YcbK (DUF882 family)